MTVLVLGAASPSASQPIDDKYWLEASVYFPSIDTKAGVSRPGFPGTKLDLEGLGLNKHETLPAFYAGARFWKRWIVTGEYYALDRNGTSTLARDITFDGDVFPAGVQIKSKLQSDVYRLTVGYAFIRNERAELGAGIGLHATDFDLGIAGQARIGNSPVLTSDNRRKKFLAPVPTVGAFGTYEITPQIILTGRIDYLSLKVGDYDGGITNAQAALAYRFNKTFEVGAGWRYVNYNLDVEKENYTASIDYDFSGPSVFLRVGFQ